MIDAGKNEATSFVEWSSTGLQQFSLLVGRNKIPPEGSLAALWLEEWRSWILGMKTLTQKLTTRMKPANPAKLQSKLTRAVGRMVHALQDQWMAAAGVFPREPDMVGCEVYVLELDPWFREPAERDLHPDTIAPAPGSALPYDGPYSQEKDAFRRSWSPNKKRIISEWMGTRPAGNPPPSSISIGQPEIV